MVKYKIDKKFGALVITGLFLVIIGQIVPFTGIVIEDAYDAEEPSRGTGEYTQNDTVIYGETITIGSEVYTVTNTTSNKYDLTVGSDLTPSTFTSVFVAEINENSSLVFAENSGLNLTTIKSIYMESIGNYATTENMTNGSWGAARMTGATHGSEWVNVDTTTIWGPLLAAFGVSLILLVIMSIIVAETDLLEKK